jgi:hypothetical protein
MPDQLEKKGTTLAFDYRDWRKPQNVRTVAVRLRYEPSNFRISWDCNFYASPLNGRMQLTDITKHNPFWPGKRTCSENNSLRSSEVSCILVAVTSDHTALVKTGTFDPPLLDTVTCSSLQGHNHLAVRTGMCRGDGDSGEGERLEEEGSWFSSFGQSLQPRLGPSETVSTDRLSTILQCDAIQPSYRQGRK